MKLILNARLCIGCGRCERVCPTNGMIVIDKIPIKCMHCEDAPCYNVCPVDAIQWIGDKVVVKEDACIGCGLCIEACPFGIMRMNNNTGKVFKCHGCYMYEEELCKEACPTGALHYREENVIEKRKKLASKFKKIYSYI
ncbi:MAG TPA: 4Fe-4S dicluster domain-containing protein [Methanothermococcus okinawensis]|uniref:4Fe-4S dicluster domain-containing protein n=1 Tax=Methanothermococcus okinawensis TaxID=155863 RepID=A0A833DRU9_9EURY|nr:4Fe-4S dicluster domain-containing protein [Methanothermococcus okinawensis]